ncbi:hypothetical protein RchiOBHm_Chr3g0481701 [Rosa chinensis]|uniref:Transmembrane protein n=1 Tax=Rosa chinensis TaxID=74649 RepID=A0A2P6RE07_ROSCH|nr:uncharacterized protein LOC112191550 [Rosa chinensis]PRQ44663.1 hypothetical protein RchiOBHm_Chr3g0481701 [Rosa chinensis]
MKIMRSILGARLLEDQLPPPLMWAGAPPKVVVDSSSSSRYTRRSIETLVVVLAVITIVGVLAGFVARLCGGRHLGDNGEYDIEGWVEKKCRSCIDGGVPPQPTPAPQPKPPATEEAKK